MVLQKALGVSRSSWFYWTAAPIGKRNACKMRSEPETFMVQLPKSGSKQENWTVPIWTVTVQTELETFKIRAGVETAFRIKQFYSINRSFSIPSFWLKEPLRCVTSSLLHSRVCRSSRSQLGGKAGDRGGFHGVGISLINFYAKKKTHKKKSSPYLYGMFGPCWETVISWERKAKTTFAHVSYL